MFPQLPDNVLFPDTVDIQTLREKVEGRGWLLNAPYVSAARGLWLWGRPSDQRLAVALGFDTPQDVVPAHNDPAAFDLTRDQLPNIVWCPSTDLWRASPNASIRGYHLAVEQQSQQPRATGPIHEQEEEHEVETTNDRAGGFYNQTSDVNTTNVDSFQSTDNVASSRPSRRADLPRAELRPPYDLAERRFIYEETLMHEDGPVGGSKALARRFNARFPNTPRSSNALRKLYYRTYRDGLNTGHRWRASEREAYEHEGRDEGEQAQAARESRRPQSAAVDDHEEEHEAESGQEETACGARRALSRAVDEDEEANLEPVLGGQTAASFVARPA